MSKLNVLISSPDAGTHNYSYHLPYVWGVLKTYCDHYAGLGEDVHWLEPAYLNLPAKMMIEKYSGSKVDLLGLSCYCWNTNINFEFAKLYKQLNPDTLIVAGGPDVPYKQEDFFETHPYIDIVIVQDGEIPFSKLLLHLLGRGDSLEHIPGLIFPDPKHPGRRIETGKTELVKNFGVSPFLANEQAYLKMIADNGARSCTVVWETDRGCPYGCVFCDWGSNTMSKVRPVTEERIRQEAEWFGRNKIANVFIANANYGMLPQDLVVCDALIESNNKYGYPRVVYWNNAKNNHKRVIQIAKKFYEANLINYHNLSVQHTDKNVIDIMSRRNMSDEKQSEIIRAMKQEGIPILAQMICGAPGDTLAGWKKSLSDLMEWGVHDEYITYSYQILPNAPAADEAYLKKWNVQLGKYWTRSSRRRAILAEDGSAKTTYIVQTSTFSKQEFAEMFLFGRFIVGFHNGNLTKHIAKFLRHKYKVSYSLFYERLYQDFFKNNKDQYFEGIFRRCEDHIVRFLEGEEEFEEISYDKVPHLNCLIDVEDLMVVEAILNRDRFYQLINEFVLHAFPFVEKVFLDDLVSYLRQVMLGPDYDPSCGRVLSLNYDWFGFFKELDQSEPVVSSGLDVKVLNGKRLVAKDESIGYRGIDRIEWHMAEEDYRTLTWFNSVIMSHYQRMSRTQLTRLEYA